MKVLRPRQLIRWGIKGAPPEAFVDNEDSNFSEALGAHSVFGGFFAGSVVFMGDLLNAEKISKNIAHYVSKLPGDFIKSTASLLGMKLSWLQKGVNWIVGNTVGRSIKFVGKSIEKAFSKTCKAVLHPVGQILIAVGEVAVMIIASILTGGLAGAGGAGLKVAVGQIIKSLAIGILAGIALDKLIFDVLLPNVVTAATGVDTALTPSEKPSDGGSELRRCGLWHTLH